MPNPNDASGFVSVSEYIPDVLLDVRYYSTYNFVGTRVDGYEQPVVLLTKEAAAALRLVSDDLREKGLRLVIYDGYRPQRAVDHFARWAEDIADTRMKAVFYPDVDKADLFEKGFIARRSGHSRGSTVDLTLLNEQTGTLLDMGGPFDFFGELSLPDYAGVTPAQHANRMLLQSAMVKRGFKPLSTEWWHFTLVGEPYPDTYFCFPIRE
ncbi:MAG: M15 family metallopeptidase [Clostridia bacterium]|nr:M15 family metallopeptidase [Clostridia bacterium]